MNTHKLFTEADSCSFTSDDMVVDKIPVHPGLISSVESTPDNKDESPITNSTPAKVRKTKGKKFKIEFDESETSIACSTPQNPNLPENLAFEENSLEADFFIKSNYKVPYSRREDEKILKFVLKGQNIFRVSSILLWKYLESKKVIPRRTYQSLKNRFLRNIKPHLFTKFDYLIQDDETKEKILAKFPELKTTIGCKYVNLSTGHINLSQSGIESTPHKRSQRVVRAIKPVKPLHSIVVRGLVTNSYFDKETEINDKNMSVTVHFLNTMRKREPPFEYLSTKFEKLAENNKRKKLCSTCGKFNFDESSGSETDIDSDIIPNSVEFRTQITPNLVPNPKRIKRKKQKKSKDLAEGKTQESLGIEPVISIKEEVESDSAMDFEETIFPKIEPESPPERNHQDAEEGNDVNIVHMNLVTTYKTFLNDDEEEKLTRQCLYKNRELTGFNPAQDKAVDAFFLESSAEVATPSLSSDCEPQTPNASKVGESQNSTDGSLLSNMLRMSNQL